MRNRKRLLVAVGLAAMALAATAAIASAAVWKDKATGTEVTVETPIEFEGAEFWETSAGNTMECPEKFTLKINKAGAAKITAFTITKTGCATAGTLSGCELSTAEAKELPWTVSINAEPKTLTIKNMRLKRTFKAGCSITELDKTINSTVTLLPEPSKVESIETSGSTGTYKQYGSFKAITNSGTYGIG